MSNIWERFNGIAGKEEVDNAKTELEPIAEGNYRVLLEELQPSESQSGLPMIKGKFRMIDGNRIIFYNQTLQNMNYPNLTAKNIAEGVLFVNGLTREEYEFENLGAFADYITTIPTGTEHVINLSYATKDVDKKFPKLKVIEDVNESDIFEPIGEDDIPF